MIEVIEDVRVIDYFLSYFSKRFDSTSNPFRKYIGYKKDNQFLSFLSYSLIYDRLELDYLYTEKNFRNLGYASILIDYLIDLGIKNKCLNITLEVRKSNWQAINFYEKHGFRKVGVRNNYYSGEDGILMLKELM